MKFKTLFLLFNLILVISFAFIFLMPLPVLGWEYAMSFWGQNWYIALAFVIILAGLNWYFLRNWKLFSLQEREDWPALRKLLEAELARRGVLSLDKTRIFVNTCLVGQSVSRISELRASYQERGVKFLPRVALSLGLPLVLEGKADAVEEFFGPLAENKKAGSDLVWIRWCLAFARLLKQNADGAKPLLLSGLIRKQPVLRLLSLYLLENLKTDPEVRAVLDKERPQLAQLTPKEWNGYVEALKERVILVLFMEKLISDARQWLASTEGETA
jgi:hypothetical protein